MESVDLFSEKNYMENVVVDKKLKTLLFFGTIILHTQT